MLAHLGSALTGDRPARTRRPPITDAEASPGRTGPHATTQARSVAAVRTTYNPDTDGEPDPGEIVWTWVPYEENDGRGKDRPVLIVAREPAGTYLAVQLSSRTRNDDREWVSVGSGAWDGKNRPSWVHTGRVLRVHADGMRREAAALGRDQFGRVVSALQDRYGWS